MKFLSRKSTAGGIRSAVGSDIDSVRQLYLRAECASARSTRFGQDGGILCTGLDERYYWHNMITLAADCATHLLLALQKPRESKPSAYGRAPVEDCQRLYLFAAPDTCTLKCDKRKRFASACFAFGLVDHRPVVFLARCACSDPGVPVGRLASMCFASIYPTQAKQGPMAT